MTQEEIEEGAITLVVKKVVRDGEEETVLGYLNNAGELVEEEAVLTIGKEEDGFTVSEDGKTYTKEFAGVGLGKYVVTEKNSTIPGYSLNSESPPNSGRHRDEERTAKPELNDEYTKDTGNLKITKTFGGDVTKEEIETGAITIVVKKVDEDGEESPWLPEQGRRAGRGGDVLTLGKGRRLHHLKTARPIPRHSKASILASMS